MGIMQGLYSLVPDSKLMKETTLTYVRGHSTPQGIFHK